MATHTIGEIKTADQFVEELHALAGGKPFPVTVTVLGGELLQVSFETEWQEGTTTPVEDEHGNIVDYEPNYTKKKLTQAEIKKINDYANENVKS